MVSVDSSRWIFFIYSIHWIIDPHLKGARAPPRGTPNGAPARLSPKYALYGVNRFVSMHTRFIYDIHFDNPSKTTFGTRFLIIDLGTPEGVSVGTYNTSVLVFIIHLSPVLSKSRVWGDLEPCLVLSVFWSRGEINGIRKPITPSPPASPGVMGFLMVWYSIPYHVVCSISHHMVIPFSPIWVWLESRWYVDNIFPTLFFCCPRVEWKKNYFFADLMEYC